MPLSRTDRTASSPRCSSVTVILLARLGVLGRILDQVADDLAQSV